MTRTRSRTQRFLTLSLIPAVMLLACRTVPNPPPPLWVTDLEAAYPPATHLAFVGYGGSAEAARTSATANLAGYFGMRVESVTEVHEQLREQRIDGATRSAAQAELMSAIRTSAVTQLVGTGYSQAYRDSTGLYSVVAYLDRVTVGDLTAAILTENDRRIGELAVLMSRQIDAPSIRLGAALAVQDIMDENRDVSRFRSLLGAAPYQFVHDTTGTADQTRDTVESVPVSILADSVVPDYVVSAVREETSELGVHIASESAGSDLSVAINFLSQDLTSGDDFLTYRYEVSLTLDDRRTTVAVAEFADNISGTSEAAIERRTRGMMEEQVVPALVARLTQSLREATQQHQ